MFNGQISNYKHYREFLSIGNFTNRSFSKDNLVYDLIVGHHKSQYILIQIPESNSTLIGIIVGFIIIIATIIVAKKKNEASRKQIKLEKLLSEASTPGKEKELLPIAKEFLNNEEMLLSDLNLLTAIITVFIRNNAFGEASSLITKGQKKYPNSIQLSDLEIDLLFAKRQTDPQTMDKIWATISKRPERKDWLKRYSQIIMGVNLSTPTALKAVGEYYKETKDSKALLYLAETYDKKKIYNETSLPFFVDLSQKEPANTRWLYAQARVKQNIGAFSDAEALLIKCLEINPDFSQAKDLLEMIKGENSSAHTLNIDSSETSTGEVKDNIPLPPRYSQISELGRGGMGIVYKAFDTVLQRWVAIKVLQEIQGSNFPEMKERFLSESRVMASLDHPVIPKVFDVSVTPPCYIALEFLEGTDMRSYIEQNPQVKIFDLIKFARDLALGFDHAAEKGVLHRDIKPENIMVEKNGRVRILDFGLAKFAQQKNNLTQAGLVVGTPWYMAPERLKGEPATVVSEIFSFGVTLYEMLTGKRPFEGDDISVVFVQEPKPLRQIRPECPLELEVLILDCLNKNPSNRPSSFKEIASELDRLIKKLGVDNC